MSGYRTSGNIETIRGQFGLSVVDNLTGDITLWDTYPDHPHRYVFTPTGNRTITLPEIVPDTDDSLDKCAIGYSLVVVNDSNCDDAAILTIVNNISPNDTIETLKWNQQTILVAESDITQSWKSIKSERPIEALIKSLDNDQLTDPIYTPGEIVRLIKQNWFINAGGDSDDENAGFPADFRIKTIQFDNDSNIVIGGQVKATNGGVIHDFNGDTVTNQGDQDIFIAKIDPNGIQQWFLVAGNPTASPISGFDDLFTDLLIDSSNNVFAIGTFYDKGTYYDFANTSYVGYGTHPTGGNDLWAVKINSNGVQQWFKRAGSTDRSDYNYKIVFDSNEDLIIHHTVQSNFTLYNDSPAANLGFYHRNCYATK